MKIIVKGSWAWKDPTHAAIGEAFRDREGANSRVETLPVRIRRPARLGTSSRTPCTNLVSIGVRVHALVAPAPIRLRPLSTLRPRCAASGYYAGEGEGESETHKRLCVAEGNDGNVRKFGEREGVRKAAQVRRIVCACKQDINIGRRREGNWRCEVFGKVPRTRCRSCARSSLPLNSTMDRGSCGTGDGDKWIRNGRRGDRDGHLLKDVGEKDAKDGGDYKGIRLLPDD